jgi:hypothetical protein
MIFSQYGRLGSVSGRAFAGSAFPGHGIGGAA